MTYIDTVPPRLGPDKVQRASGHGFIDRSTDGLARHQHSMPRVWATTRVVLFLDELILWFASNGSAESSTSSRAEGQKIAKLVEAASTGRPAPIVIFADRSSARPAGVPGSRASPGADQLNFGDSTRSCSRESRFDTHPALGHGQPAAPLLEKRLLKPEDRGGRRAQLRYSLRGGRSTEREAPSRRRCSTTEADKEAVSHASTHSPLP